MSGPMQTHTPPPSGLPGAQAPGKLPPSNPVTDLQGTLHTLACVSPFLKTPPQLWSPSTVLPSESLGPLVVWSGSGPHCKDHREVGG